MSERVQKQLEERLQQVADRAHGDEDIIELLEKLQEAISNYQVGTGNPESEPMVSSPPWGSKNRRDFFVDPRLENRPLMLFPIIVTPLQMTQPSSTIFNTDNRPSIDMGTETAA